MLFVLGFLFLSTTTDLINWIRNTDTELREMDEGHKYDNDSSNVPKDSFI